MTAILRAPHVGRLSGYDYVIPEVNEMSDLKGTLEDLRKKADGTATESRSRRDEWNTKTREHLGVRNTYNSKVRELIEEVQRQKGMRDEENAKVRAAKDTRQEANQTLRDARDKLRELQGENTKPEAGDQGRGRGRRDRPMTPLDMRRALERLEREFEMGRHTGKNEKKVMEKMKKLKSQLRALEISEANNTDLAEARATLKAAIEAQEEAHQAVTVAADMAQGAHDLMLELSSEVDRLRGEADDAQAHVRRSKREADSAHQEYIVSLRCLHSIQDVLRARRNRDSGATAGSRGTARVEVADLMSKLMSGETLSTEELMSLQRGA